MNTFSDILHDPNDDLREAFDLPRRYSVTPRTDGPFLHYTRTDVGFRITATYWRGGDVMHREVTFDESLRVAWLQLAARGIITPATACDPAAFKCFAMLGR